MDRGDNETYDNPTEPGDRMATIVNILQSPEAGAYIIQSYIDIHDLNIFVVRLFIQIKLFYILKVVQLFGHLQEYRHFQKKELDCFSITYLEIRIQMKWHPIQLVEF